GQTTAQGLSQYNGGGASSTATITASAGTVVVASASGMSAGQLIAASNNGIPFQTTIGSISSNTITLANSAKVTTTGTVTIYAANSTTYGVTPFFFAAA